MNETKDELRTTIMMPVKLYDRLDLMVGIKPGTTRRREAIFRVVERLLDFYEAHKNTISQ